ncbi:MAG TPA: 16S rRNA (guanine(966)-N(2))-methyltransferase RsmD [Rickettsiales bacterium]|nr:16S rRNA (guanine(966)-N(2))-methyltransferase RsmD [Rickettsiales bacterium]
MLKIIAGKYRGKRIEIKENAKIRPTGSKARGAIFNILMHGQFGASGHSPLIGKPVLDLFCGTGALGLEALSRGASHVTFVDESQASLSLARTNVQHLGEEENARFVRSDSSSLPKSYKTHSLAFLDPPYNSGLAPKSLKSLHMQGWLEPDAVIVAELAHKETLEPPEHFTVFDERHYGNTKIVFLRYTAQPSA